MKTILGLALAASLVVATSAAAFADPIDFGGFAGGAFGATGTGTFGATFATGFESGFGDSYGLTEVTADAIGNFGIGTQIGLNANFAAATTSHSASGSLVNGNGSAWNVTGGLSFAATGLAGGAGGVSF